MTDAAKDETGTDCTEKTDYGKYAEGAIGQGRPESTCECSYCEGCTLPTYEPGVGCVWCRNGEHRHDGAENGSSESDRHE